MSGIRDTIRTRCPRLTKAVKWCKRRKNELSALPRHLKRRRLQRKRQRQAPGKIKVAFICQYIPAWSKNQRLYEALRGDERFEALLICVPNRVFANQLRDPEDLSNDTYDYFVSHGYPEAVNALVGKDEWYDLRAAGVDYVIYNRYDRPMPIPYTSARISAHAKVCLIEYGTSLLRMVDMMFDYPFLANTYCFFAENDAKRGEFLRWNLALSRLGLSQAVCCGIPAVENAYMAQDAPAPAWSFSQNAFRAIYAPRWTTDPVWGGSTFLRYREFFLKLADERPELDFLVRPHPLMFQHFIDTGLMTAEEAAAFEAACGARPNIRLDQEKEYLATFWKSSVLICDFSSMIIEYFITGKPIIYLTYDENIAYTDQMDAMLSGCYLVNDEDALRRTIEMLSAGEDPLAPVRDEVCKTQLLQGANLKASENMKQVLLDSYRK